MALKAPTPAPSQPNKNRATDPINIKGTRTGLIVTLAEGDWRTLEDELVQRLASGGNFFKGGDLVLQLGERAVGAADLGSLRSRLADLEINLSTVLSEAPLTRNASQALGLFTALREPPKPAPALQPFDPEVPGEPAVIVQQSLRSGRSVTYAGSVVIIGDINPGAEIIAGGSVVVWGRVQGIVHAGADGDEGAVVCALDLSPTQLRIAGLITTTPKRKGKAEPELARIHNGQIIAERWETKPKNKRGFW